MSGAYVSAVRTRTLFLARGRCRAFARDDSCLGDPPTRWSQRSTPPPCVCFPLRRVILLFHLGLVAAMIALAPVDRIVVFGRCRASAGSICWLNCVVLWEPFISATAERAVSPRSAAARVFKRRGAGSTLAGILFGGATGMLAASVEACQPSVSDPGPRSDGGMIAIRCRDRCPRSATERPGQSKQRATTTAEHFPRGRPAAAGPSRSRLAIRFDCCVRTIVVLLLEYEWKLLAAEKLQTEQALATFFPGVLRSSVSLTGVVRCWEHHVYLTGGDSYGVSASFPACVAAVLLQQSFCRAAIPWHSGV